MFTAVAGVMGDGCLSSGGNEGSGGNQVVASVGGFNNTGRANRGPRSSLFAFDFEESGFTGIAGNTGDCAGSGVTA